MDVQVFLSGLLKARAFASLNKLVEYRHNIADVNEDFMVKDTGEFMTTRALR